MFEALTNLNPIAIILLGVFILVATPIVRVLVSIIVFFCDGDILYVVLATFVFIILAINFLPIIFYVD